MDLTLMKGDAPAFDLVCDEDLWRVVGISEVHDPSNAPIGTTTPAGPDLANAMRWFSRRAFPITRPNALPTLVKVRARRPGRLMVRSLGLCLTDQYWIKPKGSDVDWRDVGLFENGYVDRVGMYMAGLLDHIEPDESAGPSVSTQGVMPKWWERRNGGDWLLKGSSPCGMEPYVEALCSRLCRLVLEPGEYVEYMVEEIDGHGAFSACEGFVGPGSELATMRDVMAYGAPRGGRGGLEAYASLCESLGARDIRKAISKMVVVDFLADNPDRHSMNLGVVLGPDGRTAVGAAPLYDFGAGFRARRTDEPGTDPAGRLALASDLSWLDPGALDGFGDVIRDALAEAPGMTEESVEGIASGFEARAAAVASMTAEGRRG